MENLLSLSFDYISSTSPDKIRKGFRQIEGLLAQICLSSTAKKPSALRPGHRRHASALPSAASSASPQTDKTAKSLVELPADPAFREFFRLQDGFEWNVATRVAASLERLLGMPSGASNDMLILSAVGLLHGSLLLHPPSRKIFEREVCMNLLLDLLDTSLPPPIQAATLATLTSALLSSPHNARVFEATDGLLTITSLYKSRNTTPPVRQSLQEFLYFYLLPEAPLEKSVQSEPNTAVWRRGDDNAARGGIQGRRADTVADSAAWGAEGDGIGWGQLPEADGGVVKLRSPDEKRKLLGRYLRDADGLAQDFKDAPPFSVADRGGGLIAVE